MESRREKIKKLEDEFRWFNIQIISFRERRHKNGGKEIINGTSQEPFFRNWKTWSFQIEITIESSKLSNIYLPHTFSQKAAGACVTLKWGSKSRKEDKA